MSIQQVSFTAQSNQTSGLLGMDSVFFLLLLLLLPFSSSFFLLSTLRGRGHKHLSAFYMTSWPVLNSRQGSDGAGAKWSYIAVRGCQCFNNWELLCHSRALTGMQIFPLSIILSPCPLFFSFAPPFFGAIIRTSPSSFLLSPHPTWSPLTWIK